MKRKRQLLPEAETIAVRSDKVSFCVIATDDVQPDTFTTHFRSVIAFGRARVLTGRRSSTTGTGPARLK